jgi:predicted Rdx family selenoprotein
MVRMFSKMTSFLIIISLLSFSLSCSGGSDENAETAQSNTVRLKQTLYSAEAQNILKQIYIKQQAFYNQHHVFSDDLEEIGMSLPAGGRYRYSIELTPDGYIAYAKGEDIWEIDQDGSISEIAQK